MIGGKESNLLERIDITDAMGKFYSKVNTLNSEHPKFLFLAEKTPSSNYSIVIKRIERERERKGIRSR